MNKDSDLKKSVIITGSSDGIGRALALSFAKMGFDLGLLARRKSQLEYVKQECLDGGAQNVFIATADVAESKTYRNSLEQLDLDLNGAGIFIANAGINGGYEVSRDSGQRALEIINVNLCGAVDGIELMKGKMLQRGYGHIVGVSSFSSARGLPSVPAYGASKVALISYLESLKIDLCGEGVDVSVLLPGFIDTPLTRSNKFKMPFLMKAEKASEVFVEGILNKKWLIFAPWQIVFYYYFLKLMPKTLYNNWIGPKLKKNYKKS